jgi:hypothetical protein
MNTNAVAATRFREERLEAGLPVATNAQVKRALQLVERNPMLRSNRTPLGLQLLALRLPLSKSEKKELKLEPKRIRFGDSREVEADPASAKAFVDNNPDMTEREAAEAVARAFGFQGDMNVIIKRVERYSNSPSAGQSRICGHLREKLLMLSAVAQVLHEVRERVHQAEEAANAEG